MGLGRAGRLIVASAGLALLLGGSSPAAGSIEARATAVCAAVSCGSLSTSSGQSVELSFPSPVRRGYALVNTGGRVANFGVARLGATSARGQVAGAATTADGRGLWTVTGQGVVGAFGTARAYGSFTGLSSDDRIVGIARTADDRGYWLVTRSGRVQAFGDARSFGSVRGLAQGDHAVAIAGTADGYLIATADGVVQAFGHARSYGSWTSGHAPGAVTAIAEAPDSQGYWLAAQGGRVAAFGLVRSHGPFRGLPSGDHVVGIVATASGGGYLIATAHGIVHRFGDARLAPVHSRALGATVALVRANEPIANRAATSLRVPIVGLSPGEHGNVRIEGPRGFHTLARRTLVIGHATPGTWLITPTPIPDRPGRTRYPMDKTIKVRLSAGAHGTAPVSYTEVVNNDTAVGNPGAVQSLHESRGVFTLTIPDPRHSLHRGSTMALGVGPLTPTGLLLKITSLSRDGQIAHVTGTQGTLSDIGPQGELQTQSTITTPSPPAGTARAAAAGEDPGDFEEPYSCSNGASASISGGVSFRSNVILHGSWGGFWHPLTIKAHFEVDGVEQSNLTLSVSGQATCKFEKELLEKPIKYDPIELWVGPVPVVIVPELNFNVSVKGSVGASLTEEVSQSVGMGVGLDWDGKHLNGARWFNRSFTHSPFTPGVTASLTGSIGPELDFLIYGGAGPYLSADGNVSLDVDTTRTPWWQLTAGIEAGLGLKFKFFGHEFDKGIPDVLSANWTIAQASTPAPPAITTASLPNGTAGSMYAATPATQHGAMPFQWSVSQGTLPTGLTLNSNTGAITGTPTTPGGYSFTLTVTDRDGQTGTHAYTVVIAPPPVVIATQSLPAGIVGDSYSTTLTTSSGTPPYQWSVQSGSLPAGLTLDPSSGTISGTPTTNGTSAFTILVTDSENQNNTRSFTITINGTALPSNCSRSGTTVTCSYSDTGSEQTFTAPTGVSSVHVVAVGATGQAFSRSGGDGAQVTGDLSVTDGQTLFVEIGVGGGAGATVNAGAGGGESDVRTCSVANNSCPALGSAQDPRLIVAGGGGGSGVGGGAGAGGNAVGSGATATCQPGAAGGNTAAGTEISGGGGGASCMTGGAAGAAISGGGQTGHAGTAGAGGAGGGTFNGGGGGGAGYYGGGGGGGPTGGGTGSGGGGGGGSSFGPSGSVFAAASTGTPSVTISYTAPS